MLSRREFLSALLVSGSAIAAAGVLGGCSHSSSALLLSVARNRNREYSIRLFSPEQVQQVVLPIPARAHALSLHPSGRTAVCHDRRPGRNMYVVDLQNKKLAMTLSASEGRHFYGHGVFSPDGELLYTTENDYQNGRGIIGIYRTRDWVRIDEFSSHGVGCHELRLHPDNQTLVVANGGIQTHPNHLREKLNLSTMAPRLSYIDRKTGELLEEHSFGHHQLSIRHLDITGDGTVVVGMQFQGEKTDIQPLVAVHRKGEPMQAMNGTEEQWLEYSQYVASVVCLPDNRTAVTTTPRGGRVMFWDLASRSQLKSFSLKDTAGAAVTGPQEVTVSNGLGELVSYARHGNSVQEIRRVRYPDTGWDNHMIAVL